MVSHGESGVIPDMDPNASEEADDDSERRDRR